MGDIDPALGISVDFPEQTFRNAITFPDAIRRLAEVRLGHPLPSLADCRDVDLAWLAGLYEGEGSVSAIHRAGDRIGAPRLCVVIGMTDYDVIERAQQVVAMGRIFGPYSQGKYPRAKPMWQWRVQRADQATALLLALWPWLHARRRSAAANKIGEWLDHKDRRRRGNH